MKKAFSFFTIIFFCLGLYGQKITELPAVTSAGASSLIFVAPSGNNLRNITKANFLKDYAKFPAAGIALSTGSAWSGSITNNSANWNTAYTDRLKWDGGSTGLTAATGRTSLGGTTAGQALFTLSNPSAITFLRINADNSVTALSAANFKTALSLAASDVGLGNVTNESKATMFTNPTFTETVTIPEGFYLGGSTMDASAAELNVLNGIPGGLTAIELGYMDGVTEAVQDQIDSLWTVVNDTLSGSSIYQRLNDTIPIVTFSLGATLPADTACFNNGVLAGSFYNEGSDTLKITQLMGILKEGTGTETIDVQVSWHATFLSGSATNLNSSALTVNSLTTGTEDVSFANSKIPPNVFVWCILSGASKDNKPTFMNVTLSGYKIPKY